jgi:UDPglucose 6-dehydrogenase
MKEKISFIGLGKLGLPLSTIFAKNNVPVLGVDVNVDLIDKLDRDETPFIEDGLDECLLLAKNNIEYTTSYDRIMNETDVSVMLVNTQIGDTYSSSIVESVIKGLCAELVKSDKDYHLFILSSTVMPGEIRDNLIPMIEELTGRELNKGFGFSYVPDVVKLGSVIKDFENPDVVIVGSSDDLSGKITRDLYDKFPKNNPPVVEMTLEEAEISKVTLNAYLVSKISFANFISNICESVDNVNVDNITNAIGHHKPIGHLFLKGGLSFGGTCFPRDTKAFIKFSESVGHNASHIIATDDINKKQDLNLSKIVNTIDKESISVLGLSFKPNTPVLTESPSIKLVKQLLIKGKNVNVYDSLCIDDVKDEFSGWPYSNMRDKIKINYFKSIKECFQAGELVIIALPSDEFTIINDDWKSFDDQVILDCWRILDSNNFKQIQYKCLGKRG